MLRAFIGGLVVALIAAGIGWRFYQGQRAAQEAQARQLGVLSAQVERLSSDNQRLNAELAKVQDEEARLANENGALRKALEQAKLTGKVPDVSMLPYPPK